MVELVEFIRSNYSSANPTATQMSGRIWTQPTERNFMAPSLMIGPMIEGPGVFRAAAEIKYDMIVPVTAYTAYDVNPTNTSTSEQTAKIQRWNMIDGVRNLIANNKMLSRDGVIQLVWNHGTPRDVNLTRWRPGVLGKVQNVGVRWLEDIKPYP